MFEGHYNQYVGTLPTVCKTWGCSVCQKKLMAYFSQRIRHAVSMDGPCYFITNTLRLAKDDQPKDARYANRVLTLWLRELKSRYQRMWYVKVPELTKRKQPHFHLMIGGLGNRNACCGRVVKGKHYHVFSKGYARRQCNCLEHELSKLWLSCTGDSYRLQADQVYSARGAGKYLAKYFSKDFANHKEMVAAGFTNRFSFSRNVPKLERIQLAGTEESLWNRVERIPFPANHDLARELLQEAKNTENSPKGGLQKIGDLYMRKQNLTRRAERILGGISEDVS